MKKKSNVATLAFQTSMKFFQIVLIYSLILVLTVTSADTSHKPRQFAVRLKKSGGSYLPSFIVGDDDEDGDYVTDETEAQEIAEELGYQFKNKLEIGTLQGYFLFEEETEEISKRNEETGESETIRVEKRSLDEHKRVLSEASQVHWYEQQVARRRFKRDVFTSDFNDPLYNKEWFVVSPWDLKLIW